MIIIIRKIIKERLALTQSNTVNTNEVIYSTIKLLFVSFTFLFLSIPTSLYLILRVVTLDALDDVDRTMITDLEVIGGYCDCVKHSINFVLYCISGHKFRHHLLKLLKMCYNTIMFKDKSENNTIQMGI